MTQPAVEADWERRSKSLLASVAASAKKGRAFFESEDAAMRGDRHRFELRLPAALPFTQRNLTASPPVLSLLRLILGERLRQQEDGTARAERVEMELDTFSYVQSLPGAVAQQWHKDVAALFEDGGVWADDGDGADKRGNGDDEALSASPAHAWLQSCRS